MTDGDDKVVVRKLTTQDLSYMQLPKEFWKVSIQGVQESIRPTMENYLQHIQEMVEKPAGLLLMGGRGVGKTSIAALILKQTRSIGYSGLFVTVWELREYMKSKIQFDDTTSMLDRCREVDVLVLDNLRPEDRTDYTVSSKFLEELIASRVSRKQLTIVTSQCSLEDFKAKMPDFLEATKGALLGLKIQGKDLRAEKDDELRALVIGSGKKE